MELVDTHCHIQFPDYELAPDEVIRAANQAGVTKMLCVGCRLEDSQKAIEFAKKYNNIWATIGLHPHEAQHYVGDEAALGEFTDLVKKPKVVAVGETGLDYYYNHSPKLEQELLLRFQIELALDNNLPLIFHVREAFDDFWSIYDEYESASRRIKGVVHSFSAKRKEMDEILARGLYVGLNGIMTFSKDTEQLVCAKEVPLDRMLLETDAPFLTPVPFRGKVCEPKHVRNVAEFLAKLRGESLEVLAKSTTNNAQKLFGV